MSAFDDDTFSQLEMEGTALSSLELANIQQALVDARETQPIGDYNFERTCTLGDVLKKWFLTLDNTDLFTDLEYANISVSLALTGDAEALEATLRCLQVVSHPGKRFLKSDLFGRIYNENGSSNIPLPWVLKELIKLQHKQQGHISIIDVLTEIDNSYILAFPDSEMTFEKAVWAVGWILSNVDDAEFSDDQKEKIQYFLRQYKRIVQPDWDKEDYDSFYMSVGKIINCGKSQQALDVLSMVLSRYLSPDSNVRHTVIAGLSANIFSLCSALIDNTCFERLFTDKTRQALQRIISQPEIFSRFNSQWQLFSEDHEDAVLHSNFMKFCQYIEAIFCNSDNPGYTCNPFKFSPQKVCNIFR